MGSFGGSTSVAQWNLRRSFVALRRRLSPGFAFVATPARKTAILPISCLSYA